MDPLQIITGLLVIATLIGLVVVVLIVVNMTRVSATKSEVVELENRIDQKLDSERAISRQALSTVHKRIDSQSEKISTLIGQTKSVDDNVKLLLQKSIPQSHS